MIEEFNNCKKPFLPEIPNKKMEELDEDSRKLIFEILMPYASKMQKLNFGVEGSLEIMEGLINKGWIKILWDEENDSACVGIFNFKTGKYDPR